MIFQSHTICLKIDLALRIHITTIDSKENSNDMHRGGSLVVQLTQFEKIIKRE